MISCSITSYDATVALRLCVRACVRIMFLPSDTIRCATKPCVFVRAFAM